MSPSHYPHSSLERTPYEKKDKLEKSLNKKEGEGIKKYKMSKEMVNNIKKGRN